VLSRAVNTSGNSVVVWNPLAHNRTDIVTVHLDSPVGAGVRVLDADSAEVAAVVEDGGHTVSWRADSVASLGWRTYRLAPSSEPCGWEPVEGVTIANEFHRLRVDPARGGTVVSLVQIGSGREWIATGRGEWYRPRGMAEIG
jgi:alpha-mannosidase